MGYTFGHTAIADNRLKLISEVFNPFSKEFIKQNLHLRINSVIDLGCGPGYSTEMLADTTHANIVTGIDSSGDFLSAAQARLKNYSFIKCDITKCFPQIKADLIYMRFFLSHLKNIRELITVCIKHLNPNGLVIIDETENVFTDDINLREYLSINEALINSQGANLFIGKLLDDELKGLNVLVNESTLHPVTDSQAAQIFYINTISVWETEGYVKENYSEKVRKEISAELYKMRNRNIKQSHITWKMKRIILSDNNA